MINGLLHAHRKSVTIERSHWSNNLIWWNDKYHAFPDVVDNFAEFAVKTPVPNGTLYQLLGAYKGLPGRFEWIIQDGVVTHRLFVKGGGMNGIPIIPWVRLMSLNS